MRHDFLVISVKWETTIEAKLSEATLDRLTRDTR